MRPGRLSVRRSLDSQADVTYGDAIIYKAPGTTRFMFQNVKGLTYDPSGEDYNYYLSSMLSFSIDVFGMAETNSGWQHTHLQHTFKQCLRRHLKLGKVAFGSPSQQVDPIGGKTTFQAGGTTQVVQGSLTTKVFGPPITDDSGLGRWCGFTLIGRSEQKLSVITGYRTCSGSIGTAPLGSTFHREYVYFKEQGHKSPQPRTVFLKDLSMVIRNLQTQGNAILLMIDANAEIESDSTLQEFVASHDLNDLHQRSPAPSTYIGSNHRRIDYIFGCSRTMDALSRQGSLSYFEGPQSDHRALYIDLNLTLLLGNESEQPTLASASQRWLRSGNPDSVEIYVTKMKEYYKHHNMIDRIGHLFKNYQDWPRSKVRKLLTQWDLDQGRAMSTAELALSRRPKPYQWSPQLRNAGVILLYWKRRLREIKYAENYSTTFDRWERQIQSYDPAFVLPDRHQQLDLQTVRKHLNRAKKSLRSLQKHASSSRVSSYEELLERYQSDTNPHTKTESQRKAKLVSGTLRGEASKQLYAKLRTIVNPSDFSGLSQLQIPRPATGSSVTSPGRVHSVLQDKDPQSIVWDTIITRDDIEEHLLNFNREAFRAASVSPCGSGVIHDALSFSGLTDAATECLQGNTPDWWYGNNDLLREFFASFQIPETVLERENIKLEITPEDITRGFKSWKETTTTSPSGRHLGHYKAIISDPTLLDCLCKFLNIAISSGIAPPRWCKAVNVMIEKDPGRPKINRLRIIHLFEADYNLFLKIMWGSRLVRRAVHLNLLNDGQHGSVPGRTTMDPVMLNQLTTDLSRVLKVNYARFDNDASACFDRIIVALGMMAARRCGMPIEAVRTHAQALELMQYMVKTVYGVSEKSYTGTVMEPLFGTGQGSGASPAVWLSLVVILLNTLERVVPDRISFRSADGTIQHERLVDAFVDDTAIGMTDTGSRSLTELINALESAAQTWEQLLHFSGGALNLSKCSWYVMFWDWRNGRPSLREICDSDPNIKLFQHSPSHPKASIRRLKLTEATRILGVYQTPLGDFSAHIQVLKQKADKYSAYLRSPRITATDARVFHRSIYSPAMRYSLPAIAVDEEELDQIQSRIIPTIVQKLGLSSKLPTAIRYGPPSMGGLGLLDLRTESGIEMIKYFRHEVFGGTQVGKLLLLQLQSSQLESGLPNPLLEEPALHIPYLTPTWILSMRQFMSNHNISITLTHHYKVDLLGRHDQYIMNLSRLKGYSLRQQQDLNMVRIYLQVTTIAELVDSHESSKISEWAYAATRPILFERNLAWPRHEQLSAQQRRLWRRYISSQFLRYGRFWKTTPRPPLRDLKEKRSSPTSHCSDSASTISEVIHLQPKHRKRLLTHIHQKVSDEQLWEECQRRQLLTIASDGGLKGRKGTFGWLLCTKSNTVLVEGAGPIDGPYDTSNSTRCELGGYTAALVFLSILHNVWGKRHQCSFKWVTDSKTAIANVRHHTKRDAIKRKQPANADYLGVISTETANLRRTITPVWIKGHQRVSTRKASIRDHDITCNNRADELATWFREQSQYRQSVEQTAHTPEAKVTISIKGVRLVCQEEACIRFHINGYHLRHYIQSKQRWTNKVWDCVDFEAFGIFHNRLSSSDQIAHTKFIFDQWHTGKQRFRVAKIKDEMLHKCPCCGEDNETTSHVLRCKNNPEHEEAIRVFRRRMSPEEYHPVFHLLKEGVTAWLTQRDFQPVLEDYPSKFRDQIGVALSDQRNIGWDNAIKGYLSVEWRSMIAVSAFDSPTDDVQEGKGLQQIRGILQSFHVLTQQLWKSRNKIFYDSQAEAQLTIRDSERVEICALYSQSDSLPAGDRHYCERPLESILKMTPSSRRRWLRYMKMAKARLTRDGQRQMLVTDFYRSSTSGR